MFVPELDMVWVHSSVGLGSVGFSGIRRWLDWMQFGLWHVTSESAKIHCFDLCVIMLILPVSYAQLTAMLSLPRVLHMRKKLGLGLGCLQN